MRFAAHVLNYNQDKWILKYLQMMGPHVEKIYVGYSELPWGYVRSKREDFKNKADLSLLKESDYYDKVEIISGEWVHDHAERNECVLAAKRDGFDFLFSLDADEFYHDEDIVKAKQFILDNPDYDCYRTRWVMYWKSLDYVIDHKGSGVYSPGGPQFVVNLTRGNKFWKQRRVTGKKRIFLDGIICHHVSYIKTDEECWNKLHTFSGTRNFDAEDWYRNVWLKWDEGMTNFHQRHPKYWKRAIRRPDDIVPPKILTE